MKKEKINQIKIIVVKSEKFLPAAEIREAAKGITAYVQEKCRVKVKYDKKIKTENG